MEIKAENLPVYTRVERLWAAEIVGVDLQDNAIKVNVNDYTRTIHPGGQFGLLVEDMDLTDIDNFFEGAGWLIFEDGSYHYSEDSPELEGFFLED